MIEQNDDSIEQIYQIEGTGGSGNANDFISLAGAKAAQDNHTSQLNRQ